METSAPLVCAHNSLSFNDLVAGHGQSLLVFPVAALVQLSEKPGTPSDISLPTAGHRQQVEVERQTGWRRPLNVTQAPQQSRGEWDKLVGLG